MSTLNKLTSMADDLQNPHGKKISKSSSALENSRKQLREALSTLSEGQKSLIEVRYLGDKLVSVESLAHTLGHSEQSVKNLDNDALRALMKGRRRKVENN